MEFVGQPRLSGACNLLQVPGPCSLDVDDDESEVFIGIRPKSSPLPRRKSSVSDHDSEPEPPLCGSRRVSFADAKGLSLVQVKEFESWDIPNLPKYDLSEGEGKDTDEYFLSRLNFSLPLPAEALFIKVQDQKVVLEKIELLPGTTILKGVIRVLNTTFSKAVYVRTTLDTWSSHFDLLAEYIPGSSDGLMDCFSFKIILVPPFGEQGTRVDFCLRYETPIGTFWANNDNRNYVLFCHRGMKEQKEKQQKENLNKKSCLKPISQCVTVENISAAEASSQENILTAVSKQGEEVNTVKDKQICVDHSGTSEEDEQKFLAENRRNGSRRSRRKAARMAQLRDYFAQRDGGANDTERDQSPSEAKQAEQEENPVDKHSEMQSFSETSSKSEGFQDVYESIEACSKPLADVLNDTSQAHNYTSNNKPEKSESNNLADSATLTEGESVRDIPDKPLHSTEEPAPAELNKSVSETEEKILKHGMIYKCTSNIESEPTESVISVMSSESPVSQTSSFTFGTVGAPLYHQVFGRMGSIESSYTCARDDRSDNDRIQDYVIKMQESNQECLDATLNNPHIEEEETSLSVTSNDILDHADTLQDLLEMKHSDQRCTNLNEVPKLISGATETHPHTGNILNVDLVNALIPKETLYLQRETQEDNMAYDLQTQAIAELAQVQLPKHKCPHIKTNLDTTLAQIETQEIMSSLETSFLPQQPSLSKSECVSDETDQHTSGSGEHVSDGVGETNTDNRIGKTVTIPTTNAISVEDKLLEALHDLNLNPSGNSVAKETENSSISCSEIVDENYSTTRETSLESQEETNNTENQNKLQSYLYEAEIKHSVGTEVADLVAESMTKVEHIRGDVLDELVSEKAEHCEMEAAVSTQEDFSLAEPTKVKNWEMSRTTEETETNIFKNKEESKAIGLKTEDTEAVEKDQVGQLEDTEIETLFENRDAKERDNKKADEELVEEQITGEKENKAEDADVLEDKQSFGDEETRDIVAGTERECVEKELEYLQNTQMETIAGGDEPVEETGVEKREEEEGKEKHFIEVQDINVEKSNVQKEEEIKAEKEMEIYLKSGDKTGVEWEDHVKAREEKLEKKNWDCKDEMLVEAGEEEIVDAESEGVKDEVGYSDGRQDIIQNEVEHDLSALVSNLQGKGKENTGEGQHAHIPAEIHFYKEEDFHSIKNVTHAQSQAENESTAVEGCLCILTDDPESDQTSHSSASAESDSDDEVELYMHCLRAVHTGTQADKNRNKDTGFAVSKRPSVSRSKNLSTPMPSISESLDEEQLQDKNEDMEKTVTALSGGQESITGHISWWKETFSCSNISKTLLYATSLAVFLAVAYHYDFLACFVLYLVSVVWLCCQEETQPAKNNNRIG